MWQAFWNGFFETLTNTAKVTFWGFFVCNWLLFALGQWEPTGLLA